MKQGSFIGGRCAECAFEPAENGRFILAEANFEYFSLFGINLGDLGKYADELFVPPHSGYPAEIYKLCRLNGDSELLLDYSADSGEKYFLIKAHISENDGFLRCSGVPRSLSDIYNDRSDVERIFGSAGSEMFIGTASVAFKDGVSYVESFCGRAKDLFRTAAPHADADELFRNNFSDIPDFRCSDIFDEEIISFEFVLFSKYKHIRLSYPHRAVRISAVPIVSDEKNIIFSFYRMNFDYHCDIFGNCTASGRFRTARSGGFFLEMSDYLAAMLETGEVSMDMILSACEKGEYSSAAGGSDGVTVRTFPCEPHESSVGIIVYENNSSLDGYGYKFPMLSKREYVILRYASLGMKTSVIADTLGIAQGTVSKILCSAYKKLGIASKTDAARIF